MDACNEKWISYDILYLNNSFFSRTCAYVLFPSSSTSLRNVGQRFCQEYIVMHRGYPVGEIAVINRAFEKGNLTPFFRAKATKATNFIPAYI